MATTELVSAASVVVAVVSMAVSLAAVIYSKRQVDFASRALAEPVVAGLFKEFRSAKFRGDLELVRGIGDSGLTGGFRTLPGEVRDSAYSVCYFFEYVGHEVAFGHVGAQHVIGTMASQIVEVWYALGPLIAAERVERQRKQDEENPAVSSQFLPFFENLAALIEELGGPRASARIHDELALRRFPTSATDRPLCSRSMRACQPAGGG